MADIDDILASAIRNVWLETGKPSTRAGYYLEIEKARRIRAAIESEGLIIIHAPPYQRTPGRAGA